MNDRSKKILGYIIKTAVLLAVLVALFIGWVLFLLAYPDGGLLYQPNAIELTVRWTVTIAAIVGYIAFAVWLFKKRPR